MSVVENIPTFLNEKFFENFLSKNHKNFKINKFSITAGSKPGDNYCSEVYRGNLNYTTSEESNKNVSLIVKIMSYQPNRNEVMNAMQSHEKEVEFYLTVIPEFNKLFKSEVFGPKHYYSSLEPNKVLVLEDLNALGFKMCDRKFLLDLNHCKVVMRQLGTFHAASMINARKNPRSMDKYNFGMFNSGGMADELMHGMLEKNIAGIIPIFEKLGDDFKDVVDSLKRNQNEFLNKIKENCKQDFENDIMVLNHGDLWINNFLFKYDEKTGTPTETIFIDYQNSYYSSLGIDINFFLNTSPLPEVRENHREELYAIYYKSFSKALESLNYENIPTYSDVLKEIERKEFYGLFSAMVFLPMILMEEQPEIAGIEAILSEEHAVKIREICLNGKIFQQSIKCVLKRFNKNGILNF